MPTLTTERLVLRPFIDDDFEPFLALNTDPLVMEHFPALGDATSTRGFMERANAEHEERGFGLFALERQDTRTFIGFTGLHHHEGSIPPFPCVEVGWRLARSAWGHGFATEAGTASLALGFDLGLREIVSFTVPANGRSIAVMERLGMTRVEDGDFDHPGIPVGSPLRRHILYGITATDFTSRR